MLPIRNRTLESNDSTEVAMSKLDWKVEKAKKLTNPLLNYSTVDTSRPWVGRIDREKREFEIMQTAPFFSSRLLDRNFFQVPIRGQIIRKGQKSKIVLTFRLGLNAVVLFIFIYLLPFITAFLYLSAGDNNLSGLVFPFIAPILFTLLLTVQLDRTESKLIDLFDVVSS